MATIVLSAAGAALGSSIGGSVLGLSTAVIGRAVGATVGRAIDQRVFGQDVFGGSDVIEQGRVERFRLNGASEGAGLSTTYGRTRVSGQVIWASQFLETATDEVVQSGGGGKGAPKPKKTTVRSYSYSVSVAIALGEGVLSHVGRIWADGTEISPADVDLRFYPGTEDQDPDPKIQAVEGAEGTPAFRGTAYVVIEDLELEPYGNRVPQFNFEVVRPDPAPADPATDLATQVRAVALIPGSGEYALATTPVYTQSGPGQSRAANLNTPSGKTDFVTSVETLRAEIPGHQATSLVVSWFGDDLRCGTCRIAPKVEQQSADGQGMPWSVSGIGRSAAETVPP